MNNSRRRDRQTRDPCHPLEHNCENRGNTTRTIRRYWSGILLATSALASTWCCAKGDLTNLDLRGLRKAVSRVLCRRVRRIIWAEMTIVTVRVPKTYWEKDKK